MKYSELLAALKTFSTEQLNCDVCIYDAGEDEYYQLGVELSFTILSDVLDSNHPYISF